MSLDSIIYPRSPRETMSGWPYLPRFVDKIRLHLAGKLHSDYKDNFCHRGFDAAWLKAAGLTADQFIEVVRHSTTDGEVADWVRRNVRVTDQVRADFGRFLLNHGLETDEALRARLNSRKEAAGLSHRDDIKTFIDFIDADEKRT
ncbi:MAG: DUF5069 domain-containing protein [Verrucomicrobia bacterium]|nr:DUF5069 domain-containing protein [Verrucomicrobiota bacterium]